jgi:hypothetical protein
VNLGDQITIIIYGRFSKNQILDIPIPDRFNSIAVVFAGYSRG